MGRLRTALIVEDNDEIAEAFSMLLEQEGYAVAIAHDGREALMLLRTVVEADVVILDIALSGMDGFSFRQEQMADAQLSRLAVIVVSAGGLREEAESKQLGMPFFRKPIDDIDALLVALREACDAREVSRG